MRRLVVVRLVVVRLVAFAPLLLASAGAARAQTPVPVDGVYDGTSTLQSGSGKHCDQSFAFKLHVRERVFHWTLQNKVQVDVPVAADGSFSGENGQRFLNGKIVADKLTATSTGRGCSYNWAFTRE